MNIKGSRKLALLGSAIFAEVEEWKSEARRMGHTVIDLSIGSPDLAPPSAVVDALIAAASDAGNYRYPLSEGMPEFRGKAAEWLRWRYGAEVDPSRELIALMGSQDGLAHLALALCDPGDLALVPNPGYPIYAAGLAVAGVEPHFMPLRSDNGFLPRLDRIPAAAADKAVFMLLNYPSNPLSAVADLAFLEEAVHFARRHELFIVHDLAYGEMAFDGFRPPSILQVPGAKEVALEFHSLSKSFNMAGCRIGFAAGCEGAVQALRKLKGNIDFGVFQAVQRAGIAALEEHMNGRGPDVAGIYQRRRDRFLEEMRRAGWDIPKPAATMFVWAPIPPGWTSRGISREMLLQTGVAVIPGDAFGSEGEGYVRFALVQPEEALVEAAGRIGRFLKEAVPLPEKADV